MAEAKMEDIVVRGEVGEDLLEQYRMIEGLRNELEEFVKTAKEKYKRLQFEMASFDVRLKQTYPECIDARFQVEDNGSNLVIKFVPERSLSKVVRDLGLMED